MVLRRTPDTLALAELLPLLLHTDSTRGQLARRATQELLARIPAQELAWLDQAVRLRTSRNNDYQGSFPMGAPWRWLEPSTLSYLSQAPGSDPVVKIASFHASGFVRAAAVLLLSRMSDGSELPFLLLRCNDWVPDVQGAALAAVERRLQPTYAASFLASMYLVDRLLEQRRHNLSELRQQVQALLRGPSAGAARAAALDSADPQVRRFAFGLSAEAADGDVGQLVRRAVRDDDLGLRVWAARTARTRLRGPDLVATLGLARADRSVLVRREALLGLRDEPAELRKSLLDPCTSLRELVRFYLRQNIELDFAAIYLQEALRLGALGMQPGVGARLATAILGLSETGSASAADPIEVFTIDERPRVRKAALLCLGRLDGEQRQATLAAALSDPSPGVCRTALRALGTRIGLVGETALGRALQEQRHSRCRTYLVAALARLPRWTAVRCLLQACGDPDSAIATAAQRHLARWTAAVNAVRPTAEELATVHLLIERAPLQGSLLKELRFVLQTWR